MEVFSRDKIFSKCVGEKSTYKNWKSKKQDRDGFYDGGMTRWVYPRRLNKVILVDT